MTKRFARVPIAAAGMKGEHALRVLIALGAFAGKGGQCWPSLATIGDIAGLDRRKVPAAIGKLIAAGLVTKIGSAAGRSATYQLHYELTPQQVSALTPLEVSPDSATDTRRGVKLTPVEVTKSAPTDTRRGALTDQEIEQPNEQKEEGLFEPVDNSDDLTLAQQSWNDLASEFKLAKVSYLTDGRKSKLRARLKEAGGIEGWNLALAKVRSAAWMHGANDRGWRVSFDFLLRPDKFAQLIEGGYDQRQGRSGGNTTADAIAACDEMIQEADHG